MGAYSYLTYKRLLDVLFSFVLIFCFSPIFLLVSVAIKIDSKGAILYKQQRLGLDGKTFTIYKFRSMVVNAEEIGTGVYTYKGDPRVTTVGKVIRKTSIDELPQLFNIVKGDMSFIGPRPTLVHHPWPLEQYTVSQRKRFTVRPGVTGLAQVKGRKELPWEDRIALDLQYIENISLLLDIKIFFLTIIRVLKMSDNYNK